jgi:uncharacterized protein (TIGR01777 family)
VSTATFEMSSHLATSPEAAFAWHARPGALERLTPPWERVDVLQRAPLAPGTRVVLRVHSPLPQRWVAEHREVETGAAFRDVQVEGPFAEFDHRHLFSADDGGGCRYEDRIAFRLPLGALGHAVAERFVRAKLQRAFRYRHRTVRADLAARRALPSEKNMKIAVTGASGLVGSALVPFLTAGGDDVVRLVRREPTGSDEARWDPDGGTVDTAALDGVNAVVHLAGDGIADGRWSDAKKARIRASRVQGTGTLCEALAAMDRKPDVLVAASAVGFYGARGDEELTEASAGASDFLGNVCREWEDATAPARDAGIRVVNLRIGIVLSPAGGALAKMLTPFKLGAGGVVGSGRQWMSWIAIDDLIGAIRHVIASDDVSGPVNAVAPEPVTNKTFTKTLGRVLGRPTIFPLPGFVVKTLFGEMGEALLLSGQRVRPAGLTSHGYAFRYSDLEPALRHVLGRD